MRVILQIISRNSKVFLRDRSAVMFSFFATFIIIMLYALFLGKVNVDSIKEQVHHSENVRWLVDSWIMAGILVVNTVTVTLGVFGKMVADQEQKRINGFLVSPIKRGQLVLGYLLSAVIIGIGLSLFSLAIAEIYIFSFGGKLLTLIELLKVIGLIIVNVFSSASMVFFFASFIKSNSGFTALSSVVGSLIGFLTGIYIPVGILPSAIQTIIKFVPATHGTVLMRQVFMEAPTKKVFAGMPANALSDFNEQMGNVMKVNGAEFGVLPMILVLIFSGILFIILSTFVLKKKKEN